MVQTGRKGAMPCVLSKRHLFPPGEKKSDDMFLKRREDRG